MRAKRLASAWQPKMSSSFSRELEQYSYNDQVASLVAFGETSISACNDSHSSQATSMLDNTPNLNIGFLHQRKTLQYYCVTMVAISGIYSNRVYSRKLQHRSLVKVQPLQLQLGFSSSKATSSRS